MLPKHHCRGCGEVFCDACTTPRVLSEAPALVDVLGATRPQRLCAACKACIPNPAATITSSLPLALRAPLPPSGDRSPAAGVSKSDSLGASVRVGVDSDVLKKLAAIVSGGHDVVDSDMGSLASESTGLLAVAERFKLTSSWFMKGSQYCGLLTDLFVLSQVANANPRFAIPSLRLSRGHPCTLP